MRITPRVLLTFCGLLAWTSANVPLRAQGGPWGGQVSTLAIDPTNPTTLYAGLWEFNGSGGLYKSVDRGAHWAPVDTGFPNAGARSVVIDPANSSILYMLHTFASNKAGIVKSTNSGASWVLLREGNFHRIAIDPFNSTVYAGGIGTMLRSADGGANWSSVGVQPTSTMWALLFDPVRSSTLYFASGTSLLKSVNGGVSWSDLGLPGASSLAIDRSNPSDLYSGTSVGIFKSTDSGATWTRINSGLTRNGLLVNALAVDRPNPSILYAGTRDGMFKSTNAGIRWTQINAGLEASVVDCLAIDPTNSSIVYAGTGGGLYKSLDAGASWAPASLGMARTDVTALKVDPSNSSVVYAATSGDSIFKSTNGGTSWISIRSGLSRDSTSALAMDPANSSVLYAGAGGSAIETSGVYKSTDGGAKWAQMFFASRYSEYNPGVQALAVALSNPSVIYAGLFHAGVFKSVNGGADWTALNSAFTFEGKDVSNSMIISSVAVDPARSETVYAGSAFRSVLGGLFKSTNGGLNWTRINSGFTGPQSNTSNLSVYSLTIDPSDPSILYSYATFFVGTRSYGAICKSIDGGETWSPQNSPTDVLALLIDPTNPSTVYAGAEAGFYKTADGGSTWSKFGSGLPVATVSALAIDPNTPSILYAGLSIGGVFKSVDRGATWQPTGATDGSGAGPTAKIVKVSGDNQAIAPTRTLDRPFVVVATNASGIPVAGVPVGFTVTAGGGKLSTASVNTDSQGVASTILTVGPDPGVNTVMATAATLPGSPVTFTALGTRTFVSSVTNAASSAVGPIAPGEIVTIKGTGLGPASGVSFSVNPLTGTVDSTLAGTRVLFGAFPAPILYASPTQVNAIVPYEVAGTSQIAIEASYAGSVSAPAIISVVPASPGAFTFNSAGSGQAVAANQDGSYNGSDSPAARGSFVTLYFTGGGQTNAPGVTGSVTGAVLKEFAERITVTVGGKAATVAFAGAAPFFVDGVGQLNLRLAPDTPSGPVQPLVITVRNMSSPSTATLSVK